MKRIMMSVIVAAFLCVACRSFADPVNWWSNWVEDLNYNPVPMFSDWAVRILLVSDPNVEVFAQGQGWQTTGIVGFFYDFFDYYSVGNPFNGQEIFTRFYDNADWTQADWVADVGFTTINWPSATPPNVPNDYWYDVGSVNGGSVSNGGAWHQIPEPSTALLLGTGGMVVWFGRRKLGRDTGTKVTPKKMQKVDLLRR